MATLIEKLVVPAYYCTTAGLYGGDYYQANKNYRGLEAWSSMSKTDRNYFEFNYDALDLLIDPTYERAEGVKYQYDGKNFTTPEQAEDNKAGYSLSQPVDYSATYQGGGLTLSSAVTVKRGANTISTTSIQNNDEVSRSEFEKIPNEQRHYTLVNVSDASDSYYVVKAPFQVGNTPYAVGTTTTKAVYDANPDKVVELTFPGNGQYYFCRESYKVGEHGDGVDVAAATDVMGGAPGSYTTDGIVPVGLVISETNYNNLVAANKQKGFTIHGISPTETSTLSVSRSSDLVDLSTEKSITVI